MVFLGLFGALFTTIVGPAGYSSSAGERRVEFIYASVLVEAGVEHGLAECCVC